VERIYARKAKINSLYSLNILNIAFIVFCSTSCSSLWLHREQTVDSALANGVQANHSTSSAASTVPKEQYDELNRKYQELLVQAKTLKTTDVEDQKVHANETLSNGATIKANTNEQTKPVLAEKSVLDPSELVNKIDKALPDLSNNPVGVDVGQEVKGPAVPDSMGVKTVNNTDEIDDQISKLRDSQELIKANKFEAALTLLKELEGSKEKQIVVRSKMMLGDLLFNQGEYDLASQVYEEIINKHAFSGFVIKALGKLIVCSEKLKQEQKQAKYYSLLHDFFEAT